MKKRGNRTTFASRDNSRERGGIRSSDHSKNNSGKSRRRKKSFNRSDGIVGYNLKSLMSPPPSDLMIPAISPGNSVNRETVIERPKRLNLPANAYANYPIKVGQTDDMLFSFRNI